MRQARKSITAKCGICLKCDDETHKIKKELIDMVLEDHKIGLPKVSKACAKCQFHIKMINQLKPDHHSENGCIYCGSMDLVDSQNSLVKKKQPPSRVCVPCLYIYNQVDNYLVLLKNAGTLIVSSSDSPDKKVRFSEGNKTAKQTLTNTNGVLPPKVGSVSRPVALYSRRDLSRGIDTVKGKLKPIVVKKNRKNKNNTKFKVVRMLDSYDLNEYNCCVRLLKRDYSKYLNTLTDKPVNDLKSGRTRKRKQKAPIVVSDDEGEEILGLEDTLKPDGRKPVILATPTNSIDSDDDDEYFPKILNKKKVAGRRSITIKKQIDSKHVDQKKSRKLAEEDKSPSPRKKKASPESKVPTEEDHDNCTKILKTDEKLEESTVNDKKDDESQSNGRDLTPSRDQTPVKLAAVDDINYSLSKETSPLETEISEKSGETEEQIDNPTDVSEALDVNQDAEETVAEQHISQEYTQYIEADEHIIDELIEKNPDVSVPEQAMDIDAIERDVEGMDEYFNADEDPQAKKNTTEDDIFEQSEGDITSLLNTFDAAEPTSDQPADEVEDLNDSVGNKNKFCESPVRMSPDPYMTSTVKDGTPDKDLDSVFPSYDRLQTIDM